MPKDGRIGFQSNGILLAKGRSLRLIESGLDTICLSVDNLNEQHTGSSNCRQGHQHSSVEKALTNLAEARKTTDREVRIGIEVVLQKEMLSQLPALIAWACIHGVDFIIASHLFSYDGAMAEQSLFNPNSYEATQLFQKWEAKALAQGGTLTALPVAQLKFSKSLSDQQILQLGSAMQQEAREKNITYHFPNLVAQNPRALEAIEAQFHRAEALAAQQGVELYLPTLYARANEQRACPFIEEESVFIDKNGKVMPCHFLWHSCPSMINQGQIRINERVFGNIGEQSLEAIWQQSDYAAFRAEAGLNSYAPCWSCTAAPCIDLINTNLLKIDDCYGSQVPCGHCMWSLGWLKCL
jgi:putative metalloenzyme radical SAM/SPASM domain maturase